MKWYTRTRTYNITTTRMRTRTTNAVVFNEQRVSSRWALRKNWWYWLDTDDRLRVQKQVQYWMIRDDADTVAVYTKKYIRRYYVPRLEGIKKPRCYPGLKKTWINTLHCHGLLTSVCPINRAKFLFRTFLFTFSRLNIANKRFVISISSGTVSSFYWWCNVYRRYP